MVVTPVVASGPLPVLRSGPVTPRDRRDVEQQGDYSAFTAAINAPGLS